MCERGIGRDIILQAFHWNLVKTQGTGTLAASPLSWYQILYSMAEEIARIGFTIVYLPPPWRDDSQWEADGKHGGGEGYFWHDFDLDSRYGTKVQLTELIAKFHRLGLKVIIDLVVNHRDHTRMNADIWPYPGPCWAHGGADPGGSFMDGACDLALDNPTVSDRVIQAMDELMDECSVDGWRWDYVWGYAVRDVVSWIKQTRKDEYISIGEYWQSSPNLANDPMIAYYGPDEGARILGWARDSGGLAFDIILKRQIQTGCAAYLKYGLNARANREERQQVVTFVDNHDMGPSPFSVANGWGQQCWPCPIDFKSRAYAYILSMPGTPCVYWPDCFDWGFKDEISALIKARMRAGIYAGSAWTDLTCSASGFAGIIKNDAGEDRLALAIDSNYQGPGLGWRVVAERENQWRVWGKETM
jgi:glucan 1,4-alpha-maltotetraohydrolase